MALSFTYNPLALIEPDGGIIKFVAEERAIDFAEWILLSMDSSPSIVNFVPVINGITNEDSGQVLFDEDTGVTLTAEEAM